MGIRGLESFIENNCPDTLEPVNIGDCAMEYKKRMEKQPELLIDARSSYRPWYETMGKPGLHLGLYKDFELYILNILDNYLKHDIKCIFFFDGSPDDDRESFWIKKANENGKENRKRFELAHSGESEEALESYRRDPGFVLRSILRRGRPNCVLITTVREADDEILEYVAKNGCFGVLAQDTDFLIMEGIENYFSAKHMNMNGLLTIAYRRKKFALNIGIDETFLPLFATLSGNDVLSDDDLRPFHLLLIGQYRNYKSLCKRNVIPKSAIFKEVVLFIHGNLKRFEDKENLARIVVTRLRLPHLYEKFYESIKSYLLAVQPDQRYEDASEEWTMIINEAERRHRHEGVFPKTHCVLTRLKYYSSSSLDMNKLLYPCSNFLTMNLRRRHWGILLKNRPQHLGEKLVKEFVYYEDDISSVNVTPCFPDNHPGLLELWRDSFLPEEDKLRLLCWAVSENVNVMKVHNVPRSLRIAALTIFYLVHEVQSGLTNNDIKALLVTEILVPTMSPKEVSELPCGLASALEIHIQSVYINTRFCISAIDDTCGSPADHKKSTIFFDGKVFHHFYKLSCTGDMENVINAVPDFNIIMDFIYN